MFIKIREWFGRKVYQFQRYLATVKVDVYPRSPFYPPRAVVSVIFLKRYRRELEEFKTQYTRNYDVDFNHIVQTVPVVVDWVHVHYPQEWFDMVDYARSKREGEGEGDEDA